MVKKLILSMVVLGLLSGCIFKRPLKQRTVNLPIARHP